MKIKLHIERISVEGLPLSDAQGPQLRRAIEAELIRLMDTGELRGGLGGTIAHVTGPTMQVAPNASVADIGARIAGATYSSLFQSGGIERK
jgi:hypothetical protein